MQNIMDVDPFNVFVGHIGLAVQSCA